MLEGLLLLGLSFVFRMGAVLDFSSRRMAIAAALGSLPSVALSSATIPIIYAIAPLAKPKTVRLDVVKSKDKVTFVCPYEVPYLGYLVLEWL